MDCQYNVGKVLKRRVAEREILRRKRAIPRVETVTPVHLLNLSINSDEKEDDSN